MDKDSFLERRNIWYTSVFSQHIGYIEKFDHRDCKGMGKNATLVFKGRKLRIFGYEAPNTTTQELNRKEEEEIWEWLKRGKRRGPRDCKNDQSISYACCKTHKKGGQRNAFLYPLI